MMQIKRIGAVQVSPDGKRVAYTVREAVMGEDKSEHLTHIYLANADGSGARQLTRGDHSSDDPQWSVDSQAIVFISGRRGKKNLWMISLHGGDAIQLTNHGSDIGTFRISPQGNSIAFTALDTPTEEEQEQERKRNDARVLDENPKLNRLFLIEWATDVREKQEARQISSGRISVAADNLRPGRPAFDWSPDAKRIAVSHTKTPRPDDWPTADILLVDVASGKVTPVANSSAAESSPLFSPCGSKLVYTVSDDPPRWAGARRIHVAEVGNPPAVGGKAVQLAEAQDGFGRYSDLLGWEKSGEAVYFGEVHRTSYRIMKLPLDGGSARELSKIMGMSLSGALLNDTRSHWGYSLETCNTPPEAFVSPVERFDPVAVSEVHRNINLRNLAHTETIRWKSSEDFEIEGLLTFPVGYQAGRRYPLLVIVHGGPMGAFTKTFNGSASTYPVAAFAEKGFAILRPNVRGSSGYGQKFRYANHADWGGGDFRDMMAGIDHLIGQKIADSERLGIMGWSYGGYMTAWTITQTKRFRAASVGAGVANLMSFTGTADIPGFLPDYFGGEFWDKPEVYRKHSPMFHMKEVTTPTLIQHGEKDERVPLSQGQELYNALKRQGCETKMIVYPRTPHGIEEPRLLLDCMRRNLEWFEQKLLGT
jgi:dipeptidyl aminopeptidase/acylaminoacyl peptidase